ncbi:MAG: ECF transporter S component [Clostridiales bacterium]|nr:ECF transporter S component [Clostridiales bacterium]
MKRNAQILSFGAIILSLAIIILWQIFFSAATSYYLVSAMVLAISALPFLFSVESKKIKSRELALMAVLIALGVVSRAVFYYVPQFKPIAAVVICSGAGMGARRGYVIGAFSAFISNFLFGQGIWTPFQMVALGTIGFLAGVIFKHVKITKIGLAICGFLLVFIFYGLIVDLCTVLIIVQKPSLESVLAVYAAGMPFNAVFAGATALFLFLLGKPFIKKLDRIIIKYEIT